MNTIIKVKNIYKTFKNKNNSLVAVNNLSFEIKEGSCFGLLGPNGAGKTTMMKMIYGKCIRDKRNDSVIDILGLDPNKDNLKIKSFSGVVPQEDNLDTELNLYENLLLYSKFYDINKKTAEVKIDELIDFFELKVKKTAKIDELSGGMKRRLMIARALINSPKILILDEPTTGLDPQVRYVIWDKIRKLKREGVTIILTTHYMDEAFQLCDNLIIMNNGEKILEGTPNTLLKNNIEGYVLQIDKKYIKNVEKELSLNKLRYEEYEETVLIYSNSLELLEELSVKCSLCDYYIRKSNLEDLFIKTTGRGLNE